LAVRGSDGTRRNWRRACFTPAGTTLPAALALEGTPDGRSAARINSASRKLEQKIRQKNEVPAELMAEHLSVKKELRVL